MGSSRPAEWATCWHNSSWHAAKRCSMFRPPWRLGSACSPPVVPARAIPMMPTRSLSPPFGPRGCAASNRLSTPRSCGIGQGRDHEGVAHECHVGRGGDLAAASTPCLEQCAPSRGHHHPSLTPALGALLPTVRPLPVEGASDPDPLVLDVGPAQGAELTSPGTCQDGQGQEHPPALVALGPSGQECLHLLDGGNLQLDMAQGRRLGTLGRVAVQPPPADGLAE